jgi:hypothetical protein
VRHPVGQGVHTESKANFPSGQVERHVLFDISKAPELQERH